MNDATCGVRVDRDSCVPLYRQIYDGLRFAIMTGRLPPGSPIPSQVEFSQLLGVNHITLRRAMALLEDEGFIARRRRAGTTVTDPREWKPESELHRLGIVHWERQPSEELSYSAELWKLLEKESRELGMDTENIWVDAKVDSLSDLVRQRQVSGIVCAAARRETAARDQLAALRVPIVALEQIVLLPGIDTIQIDSVPGVYEAMQALIALGHWDIAYVGGLIGRTDAGQASRWRMPHDSPSRLSGYRQALDDAGIRYQPARVYEIPMDAEPAERLIRELDQRKHLPSAVFCFSDTIAVDVVHACEKLGLSVPGDISVVGFGDYMTEALRGELATVKIDWPGMARLAVQRIHERMHRGGMSGLHITVETSFKPGSSMAAPALARDRPDRSQCSETQGKPERTLE